MLSALVTAMSIAVLAAYGTDEPDMRALIRATARTSLALFLLAFAVEEHAGRAVAAPWPYALATVALLGVAILRFAAWRRKRTSR